MIRYCLLQWLLWQLLLGGTQGQTLPGLEQYAQQLADNRLFAGMVHVEQGTSPQSASCGCTRLLCGVLRNILWCRWLACVQQGLWAGTV